MQNLPIDDVLPEIIERLKTRGALVLKAEPGAGKTTRVAPAILDAGLANLQNNRPGQIVVLQPRRVAARAAAARMSEERGSALGGEIGYRVRHEGRSSKDTRILVCTTGVFLRRLQDDPSIEDIAVVIFDEFHERSVDSDLALALSYQVKEEIRADLRLIVMSATLDSAPIAAYLGDCPAVECPGRTFPIEIEYLRHPSSEPVDRLAANGVEQMIARSDGDVLVFLPGVAEIRQTQEKLEPAAAKHNLVLMPLYGDMPLAEQQAVLQPCNQRKVVLATNVAETSLTIDGVKAVVDTGLARVNRLDPELGFNRLELSRISKASAAQRAGRAGRTAAGACLRLWSERDQAMLAEYELPEVERVELSECLLQLIAWGEHNVAAFPWFEKPPATSIERAIELLELLGATSKGKLTELGRSMSRLPLQPRLARLLLEGARYGQTKRAALCAALLSERAPFRATDLPIGASLHTDSDLLEQLRAIEAFEERNDRHSIMGDIIPGAAKQVLRVSDQLAKLLTDKEPGQKQHSDKSKVGPDEAVLRSIMAAFPDRICKRRQAKEVRAVMVGGKGVKLSEQSTVRDAQLFVAVDLIDLNRSDLSVRRASAIERSWLPEALLSSAIDVAYDQSREKVVALKRSRFCDLILDETVASIPSDIDPGSVLADAVLANFDLETLVDETARHYLARLQCLREWLPELDLPDLGSQPWKAFLPAWCCGCTSIAELKSRSLMEAIQSTLTRDQLLALDREAPESLSLPSGRPVKLQYEAGKQPIAAARIQELFGLAETPRIARSRVTVMMHLLAPNYRVQQITPDLASFWKNTYPEVKKELKGRYPKHAWPDDPLHK